MTAIEEVASSSARLKIAEMVSTRPRTLAELADATGISVQGVLKHVKKLRELGLISEVEVKGSGGLGARKAYVAEASSINGYSTEEMMVVQLEKRVEEEAVPRPEASYRELESLAEDVMLLRRRVREQSRRMSRIFKEIAESTGRMAWIIRGLGLTAEEEMVLTVLLTEESEHDAALVLERYYGSRDGRSAIEGMVRKAGAEGTSAASAARPSGPAATRRSSINRNGGRKVGEREGQVDAEAKR